MNGANMQDSVPRTGPDAEARQHLLNQMNDFAPFWS
jgi:carbonic anhydrase